MVFLYYVKSGRVINQLNDSMWPKGFVGGQMKCFVNAFYSNHKHWLASGQCVCLGSCVCTVHIWFVLTLTTNTSIMGPK